MQGHAPASFAWWSYQSRFLGDRKAAIERVRSALAQHWVITAYSPWNVGHRRAYALDGSAQSVGPSAEAQTPVRMPKSMVRFLGLQAFRRRLRNTARASAEEAGAAAQGGYPATLRPILMAAPAQAR
jgi:hypothetical protein